MTRIAAVIMAIESALGLVSLLLMLPRAKLPINSYLNTVFNFLCWLFIAIALYKHGKQAKVMCLLALGMSLLTHFSSFFIGFIGAIAGPSALGNTSQANSTSGLANANVLPVIFSFVFSIITMVSYYYLGLYLKDRPRETKKTNMPLTDTKSSIEKVSELKGLLDKGIITQEEFEAKKKEIVG